MTENNNNNGCPSKIKNKLDQDIICGKQCGNNKYCKFHEYLNTYTAEMVSNITFCSTCRKFKYKPNQSTCNDCRNRSKNNRIKNNKNIIKCNYEKCIYKQEPKLNNGYCGLHQTIYWKNEQEKDGTIRVCNNYVRGCRNLIDIDNQFKYCEDCRIKERPSDKVRSELRKEMRIATNAKIITKNKKERKLNDIMCCSCCKGYFNLPHFLEDNMDIESKILKQCKKCRNNNIIRDSNESRIEYKKAYEQSEVRKEYKKTWREENNNKLIDYYTKYRNQKINQMGIEKYHEKCAENAKLWRKNNQDLVQEYYEKKKLDPRNKYKYYKYTAKLKGLVFDLDEEECTELFNSNCYYCGIKKTDDFNIGIDRLDCNCDLGYIKENVVACCMDCNMIKNTIPYNIFVEKIIHILSYNKIIPIEEHKLNFTRKDNMSIIKKYHSKYMKKAIKRQIEFNLTKDEFNKIINCKCYICGSAPDNIKYYCGIDRVDSTKNYSIDNCMACCKECNIIKNNYNLDYFKKKLLDIYNNLIKNKLNFLCINTNNKKELDNKKILVINKNKNVNYDFSSDSDLDLSSNDIKDAVKDHNTVLLTNQNKVSSEMKKSMQDYDKKLRDNITVLTNTDKELIKIKIQEYSTSAKDDNNRNNPKVREYIDTIIKPKALELTKEYFKNNDSENPLISWNDSVKSIIKFDKKLKEKKILNKKEAAEKRRERDRIRKQIYRKKKCIENNIEKKTYIMGRTDDEKKEYRRLQKQKQRLAKKQELLSDSDN